MNFKLLSVAAVAAMGLSATANAATTCTGSVCTDGTISVTVTSTPEASLPGGVFTPGLMPAGSTMIDNFDTVSPAYGFTVSGGQIFAASTGIAAAPPGDTTAFEAVQPGAAFTITDTHGRLTSISFYMGSPDDTLPTFFNELDLTVNGGHTIALQGGQIWGGSAGGGDQTKGFLITYTFAPDTVHSLTFSQVGSPAFEFDNLSGVSVPEPASWALMIMGFGLAGATLRGKRRQGAAA
jgi:PEP-CTERM motif